MRRQVLAALVDPTQTSILEIRPAFDPIFARREGYRTRIADHTDRAGLAEKYAYRGNSWESFEDVDFVFGRRGTMAQHLDVHHWVFTPHHLRLLFRDLAELGYIALRESLFHDTVGCEFFIGLSRTGDGPGMDRQALLVHADAERALPDSPLFERG